MQEFLHTEIEIMEAATNRISKFRIQNLTIKTLAEDIGLSEPALYRHFKSKNEILLSLLSYFKSEMKNRIQSLPFKSNDTEGDKLRAIFNSQLQTFTNKPAIVSRSEEHTSELQSRPHLVCRLLLEKKNVHNLLTSDT